jgi:release factor glutamine methyltransferase
LHFFVPWCLGGEMVLFDILKSAREILQRAGCDTPALDAELLAAHILGSDRTKVIITPERILSDAEAREFRVLVARRARREPLPYILGEWEFFGLALEVSPAVLIPRPETETLVEACLERSAFSPSTSLRTSVERSAYTAIDVGTGSGAIAVALAYTRPDLHLIATDASPAALEIAAKNVAKHNLQKRISLQKANLLTEVGFNAERSTLNAQRYSFIVSNLPYIPTAVIATLAPEVRDYEPHSALDGGADGLDYIRILIAQAPAVLEPGGFIALEISPEQAGEVMQLLKKHGFARNETVADLSGRPRVVVGYSE